MSIYVFIVENILHVSYNIDTFVYLFPQLSAGQTVSHLIYFIFYSCCHFESLHESPEPDQFLLARRTKDAFTNMIYLVIYIPWELN